MITLVGRIDGGSRADRGTSRLGYNVVRPWVLPTRSKPNRRLAAERGRTGVVGNTGSSGRLYSAETAETAETAEIGIMRIPLIIPDQIICDPSQFGNFLEVFFALQKR